MAKPKWVRQFDYYTRETRTLPPGAFKSNTLYKKLKIIENAYRQGRLNARKMSILGAKIRNDFNIDYKILSDRHAVFLPRSNEYFYKQLFENKPQLTAIMGNRGTGKTITAWRLVRKFFDYKPNGQAYIYGDVDNMTPSFQYHFSQFKNQITYRHNLKKLPPNDNKPKIALYNELSRNLMGKRAMADENINLNLQALRSRHRNTWVIYNVIRYTSLESLLRETADIQLFKWLGGRLMKNVISALPNPYGEIVKYTERLTKNESLIFIPVEGEGTYIGIFETNPSDTLLKSHDLTHKFEKPEFETDEEEIDGLDMAYKFYKMHEKDYDAEKYDKPAVKLHRGRGKKSVWIPLSYGNLAQLFKEHKQSIARRLDE